MKTLVYEIPVELEEDLLARVLAAVIIIHIVCVCNKTCLTGTLGAMNSR